MKYSRQRVEAQNNTHSSESVAKAHGARVSSQAKGRRFREQTATWGRSIYAETGRWTETRVGTYIQRCVAAQRPTTSSGCCVLIGTYAPIIGFS